jgi:hypothetical protein
MAFIVADLSIELDARLSGRAGRGTRAVPRPIMHGGIVQRTSPAEQRGERGNVDVLRRLDVGVEQPLLLLRGRPRGAREPGTAPSVVVLAGRGVAGDPG